MTLYMVFAFFTTLGALVVGIYLGHATTKVFYAQDAEELKILRHAARGAVIRWHAQRYVDRPDPAGWYTTADAQTKFAHAMLALGIAVGVNSSHKTEEPTV